MRNQVARFMNTVNKNSIHKDLKRESVLDSKKAIEEALTDIDTEETTPCQKKTKLTSINNNQ